MAVDKEEAVVAVVVQEVVVVDVVMAPAVV